MGYEISEVKYMLKGDLKFERMKKRVGIIQHTNETDRSGTSEKSCQILTRSISIDGGHK
jgi:hypothetical protein